MFYSTAQIELPLCLFHSLHRVRGSQIKHHGGDGGQKKMKGGEMFCKGRRGERETERGLESGEEGSVPFSSRCRIIQKARQCSLTIIC